MQTQRMKVIHLVAGLTLALLVAGCSELDRMATINAEGLVDHGNKLGIPIGAALGAARGALSNRGLIETGIERGGSCNSPRTFPAEYTVFFVDLSWRRGTVCLGVTRGRVSHIAWLYNALSP